MPNTVPLASGSQSGAPSPVSAGTNTTPPVSGTVRASASLGPASFSRPRPSRSHWIAAPVTNTDPSSAYVSAPEPSIQATVDSNPFPGRATELPVFASTNDP